MKKKIGIISMNVETANFYKNQLETLFYDFAEVFPYSFEDHSVFSMQRCDLFLISSTPYDLGRNDELIDFIPKGATIVNSRVTFTKDAIKKLSGFKKGTKAILANQNQHMALESISQLYHLGISNIEFQPYYPGVEETFSADLVVAPGEVRYAPKNSKKVIDLGCRVLTANTISEIALKLGYPSFLESDVFMRYTQSLAVTDYSLNELSLSNMTLENKLKIIVNALDVGIIMVDEQEYITIVNTAAENILKLNRSHVIGKQASLVIPYIPFELCKKREYPLEPKLIKVKGMNINLTLTRLYVKEQYVGAFAMIQKFEDGEKKQSRLRLQMLNKGYRAKYTFDDIVGESHAICKTCDIAKRMANNDATILLEGESGTGKELFAHAIHNASNRRNYPFIAINCSALPETLLESELFGYEEGAFTGAKKGGKIGLFEFAHEGTVFLDEIENMSPSLQAKLLRILQEKEVTRIGANHSIPVNVRIISASNKNLYELMQKRAFRKDLYYRLSVIPIYIPPLRDRGEDVLILIEHFKRQLKASFKLTKRAKDVFLNHRWEGNVRELRNYVEYLKYMGKDIVDIEDLPRPLVNCESVPSHFYMQDELEKRPNNNFESLELDKSQLFILEAINDANIKGIGAGRKYILNYSLRCSKPISEYKIRCEIDNLKNLGYVKVYKGRGGCRLTDKGILLLSKYKRAEA